MVFSSDSNSYIHVVRLNKGERWSEAFAEFTTSTKVNGAWVTIIGGVLEVTLGYYDLEKKQYEWQTFQGLREITGIQGNIALNEQGEPMAHLHGSFSDENYQMIGGHVKDFVAAATVEVFVQRFSQSLHRKTDPDVGLQTLSI
ncbi:MAG TPA: PPC domain-containing DNA-binding protein [Candidatus Saccharimonadales bacterium]|nr:PPC domain-containing DNA-binding protein [Candidatus Saccharimonadales bacterium]